MYAKKVGTLPSTCCRIWNQLQQLINLLPDFYTWDFTRDLRIFWLLSWTWGWAFTRVWDYTRVSTVYQSINHQKYLNFSGSWENKVRLLSNEIHAMFTTCLYCDQCDAWLDGLADVKKAANIPVKYFISMCIATCFVVHQCNS